MKVSNEGNEMKAIQLTDWRLGLGMLVVMGAIATGSYQMGFSNGMTYVPLPPEPPVFEPSYTKDLPSETELAKKIERMQQELADLATQTKQLPEAAPIEIDFESISPDEIAALETRLNSLPSPDALPDSDFLANPELSRPTTPSGVSTQVLDQYQQETGISQQEIEQLMKK